ncbi:unnamed protein product [Chrysodeixis includens]|uniref:Uncharacterized protein n=1 Tax=Chrysodeixis includens TaxID=689277 RepID=A0A9P0C2N2_CHRIL|nr:unnamed protein product [Chrysodeixis includens]
MFVVSKGRYFFIIFTIIMLEGDTKRLDLKGGIIAEKRDYRPSKWVANSAMDVWYGNRSMIDVLSREFSEIMSKLTARPVRSTLEFQSPNDEEVKSLDQKASYQISKVEIKFFNEANETLHSVKLQPTKTSLNTSIVKE